MRGLFSCVHLNERTKISSNDLIGGDLCEINVGGNDLLAFRYHIFFETWSRQWGYKEGGVGASMGCFVAPDNYICSGQDRSNRIWDTNSSRPTVRPTLWDWVSI